MIRAFEQLFELLGREPVVDPQAPAEIAAVEAKIGRRLPMAVREWFSFAPACRADCAPASLSELVKWTESIGKDALAERLYLGIHDGDVVYFVRWDDGDDPIVRLEDRAGGAVALPFAECGRFSWNVWFWTLRKRRWDYWARTFSLPFGPAAWEFLSQRYHMDRLPWEVSADVVFFERDVSIELHWDMGDPTQQHTSADVVLTCRTREAFVRAARTLGPLVMWFAENDPARDASAAAREILAQGIR